MSIPLTGTGGLFTRLDTLYSILTNVNLWRGTGAQTVSSLTGNGVTTTVTTLRPHGYTTNDVVTIAGSNPTTPNGSQTITVTGASTFTYASAYNGTAAAAGPGPITAAKTAGSPEVPFTALVAATFAQFTAADQALSAPLYPLQTSYQSVHQSLTQSLQSEAQAILMQMVQDDAPQAVQSVPSAMAYLINQITGTQTVQKPTITSATVVGGSNVGNGTLGVSLLNGNSLQNDYIFPEALTITCTSDGQSGGVAAQEQFSVVGPAAETDTLNYDWPLGSGVNTSLNTIDFLQNNSGGNLLTNSGYQTQTVANTPDNWPITTGTPGTTIMSATGGNVYRGTQGLAFVGTGAELTNIYQPFGLSPGTPATLSPLTQYGVFVVDKVSAVPAAGVLEVALTDGTGTIVNDAQGNANSLVINLTGEATAFTKRIVFFRTPAVTPATGYRLRVRLSTALDNTKSVYFQVGMTLPTPSYPGGPSPVLFAGPTNFIKGDLFTLTITNLLNSRWQLFFERVFGMRAMSLQLPSGGAPTLT